MNTITIDILEEEYMKIPVIHRQHMQIKLVEPKDYDYSGDEAWIELKKRANKAYKDLKKIEFEIRQKDNGSENIKTGDA